MTLQGKTAIVTGAAGGIGRASALALAREGAVLVLGDTGAAVEDTAEAIRAGGGKAIAIRIDCATESGAAALVEAALTTGRLDILHANAGILGSMSPSLEIPPERFAEVLRVNLIGPWLLIRAAAPHLAPGASIICTASVAGLRAGAGDIAYSASKAGVVSLVQTSAQALAGRAIRVNAVAPGLIETPMTAPIYQEARAKGREEKIGQLNPLRRGGQPEEIAAAVVFLASEAASYINGQVLAVDGGLSSSHPFTPRWS